MSRLSPAALLLIGAALVPIAIEFPVILTFVGIRNFSFGLSFALFGLVFLAILVWSEVADVIGSSAGS
ncbi:CbaC protein [Halorientalis salina]|uniref:CbaC protein n=1 Tax=Halorientalis salina TaxID=2932266 RepID=UPI0010AC8076|nr:CbaC protein [Halorientalis salina]